MGRVVRRVPQNRVTKSVRRRRSTLLKIGGSACMVGALVLTAKGTAKSVRMIDQREGELGRELTAKEKISLCWKNYILPITAAGGSIASFWYNDSLRTKETAAMAVAYTAAEKTLTDFKNEVKEKIGENKAKEIEAEVNNKQVQEQLEVTPKTFIQTTGEGSTLLFYEPYTNTFFYSTPNVVERAINITLTGQLRAYDSVCINDLLDILNLNRTDAGAMLGWETRRGISEIKLEKGVGVWLDEDHENNSYWKISYNESPLPLV